MAARGRSGLEGAGVEGGGSRRLDGFSLPPSQQAPCFLPASPHRCPPPTALHPLPSLVQSPHQPGTVGAPRTPEGSARLRGRLLAGARDPGAGGSLAWNDFWEGRRPWHRERPAGLLTVLQAVGEGTLPSTSLGQPCTRVRQRPGVGRARPRARRAWPLPERRRPSCLTRAGWWPSLLRSSALQGTS